MSEELAPHRWQPGQSGNPGGRSRAFYKLADRIRKRTRYGSMLVSFALKAMAGKVNGLPPMARMDALYWLADRGWGKPTQSVELATNGELQPTISIGMLNILQGQGVAQQVQLAAVDAIRSAQQQAPQTALIPAPRK